MVDNSDVGRPSPATGSPGGFEFDPDKIDGVIQHWQDLQNDLKNDAADANLMAAVQAPGMEFASGDFEKSAGPSGKAFLEENNRTQGYVKKYVDALLEAKKKITTKEADVQADISTASEQAP